MPTYEYICKNCGHTFEIVHSMSDAALTLCPECGGELRKVFAPPAIAFKGSGFYATDHGKRSKKAPEKTADKSGDSDSKESGKPAASGEKKGSAKPSEKTVTTSQGSSSDSGDSGDSGGGSSS
jgi:putative FmdB family regulatory protein